MRWGLTALLFSVTALLVGCASDTPEGPEAQLVVPAPPTGDGDTDVTSRGEDIRVASQKSPRTNERGDVSAVTIQLARKPRAAVVIPITSSDEGEVLPSVTQVTFTPDDWDEGQTVRLEGRDDALDDGDQRVRVSIGPAVSKDDRFHGQSAKDLEVVNVDDDVAGFEVSKPSPSSETTEAGAAATFSVRLRSQPTEAVTVPVLSSDPREGFSDVTSLRFEPTTWNIPQRVTVTGRDDATADGDRKYAILLAPAQSKDAKYGSLDAADIEMMNLDDDIPGFFVIPGTLDPATSEAGGTATATVRLRSKPTADVTIAVSTSNAAEGVADTTALTFTPENYAAEQVVTVTGQDDPVDDDNVPFTLLLGAATSADAKYEGLDPNDVAMTNLDDDVARVLVGSPTPSTQTTEAGGAVTFTVRLATRPTANVVVPISSSHASEGRANRANVTFTPANWNAAQTVTVTGRDDAVDDGDVGYSIVLGAATSADPKYAGMNPNDVPLTNVDDDARGVSVSAPTPSATTTEDGAQVSFTVQLNTQPTASVTIPVASSATGEGTVDKASLTFTAANWNQPQAVTVTGRDDSVVDGAKAYSIVLGAATSADALYAGIDPADVALTNADNDSAAIVVSAPTNGGQTTEAGGKVSFTVVLTSQPTANVAVSVASSATAEGTVDKASLTFTAANWNQAQTVTVTGVNDFLVDGAKPYAVLLGAAVSADPVYAGLDPADVALVNADNDSAGITVSAPNPNNQTTEAGGKVTFTVVLTSQPTADVAVPVSVSNGAEASVDKAQLTFTSANWNQAQTVTVTGLDDMVVDGTVAYSVVLGAAVSADGHYGGLDAADVALVNVE